MPKKRDHRSSEHPDLENKPGKTNWVEEEGGLPSFLERVAKHIHSDSGYPEGAAIAAAVNKLEEWAPKNAKAAKALAEWNAMKARARAKRNKKSKVSLSLGTITHRPFDETKYRRVGGKFAPKATPKTPTSKGKPQTARAAIEGLGVGASFDIPGISGKIQRTEQGFVVTGPNGFRTTAATATEAISVAARLIRQKMKIK